MSILKPQPMPYRFAWPFSAQTAVNLDLALQLLYRAAGGAGPQALTFADLPTVPIEGMMVGVTDSTTSTWGAPITGGGTHHVLAYYNGTHWTVAGK